MSILYQPQYRVHGTTTWSNWGSPTATTSTIVGANPPGPSLAPSTQYDFQIVASNSFGSTPSAIISTTTAAGTSITGITLSNQNFIAGGTQGTVVGAVNVTLSSGTFSGSLTVTGTDAAIFQSPIVGGNLVLSGATTTARTYNINIVATQTGLATFSKNFPSITATAASQESVEGLIVNTVGPIVFSSQNAGFASPSGPWDQFSLVNAGAGRDPQISLNGSTQTATGNVAELIYHNHTTYQENTSVPPGWWRWDTATAAWIEYGVSAVTLSANTFAANAPVNTLVGTIAVTMKDGSTFSGTLAVDDITHFKIVGNQLQAAATLSATSYPINITAVPAVSGANKIGEQSTLAQTITQQSSLTLVQAPLGIHLGTSLFAAAGPYANANAHWNAVISAMGRTPAVVAAVGANTHAGYPGGSAPNVWGGGDLTLWTNAGIPTTVFPLLTWSFTNGSVDNDFSDYANAATATFSGQTYAHWIQAALTNWKNAGFTKVYIRINWEFNSSTSTGGPLGGFGVGTTGNLAAWRNAWRGFANAAHSVAGLTVKIVWCPSATNDTGDPQTLPSGQNIRAFFPSVNTTGAYTGWSADGFAGGAPVGGKFVDVIGPDVYAFGGSTGTSYPETNSPAGIDRWYFDSLVKMCQENNCTIAISELGDFSGSSQTAWQDWIPNHFVPYLQTLKNLTPAVPIEYCALFDVTVSHAYVFSNKSQTNTDLMGWRACLGAGGTAITPTPILTTAV